MSDALSLVGSIASVPISGNTSGALTCIAQLNESMQLTKKQSGEVALTVDSAVSVQFGGVTSAHFVYLRCFGGPITVQLTSTAGTDQSIPVESHLSLFTHTTPITAIKLIRTPSTATTVTIFLGQHG